MTLTVPTRPSTWIDYGDIIVADGLLPHCAVMHQVDGYMPIAVHTAIITDKGWEYHSGQYFKADQLDEARKALFAHRHYHA